MAYISIPNRPGWQFKDDPTNPGFSRSPLHNKQTGGVRTTGSTQVYVETKKSTDPDGTNRGEISATFYNKEVKPASFFSGLGVQPFGGQAFTYPLTSATDPTSPSWTAKPTGYTYYPGEGIGADAPITNMSSMFRTTAFNEDMGGWDVSTVLNFTRMFEGTSAFNQNISAWNTSIAVNMNEMFGNAAAFNQNISGWSVDNVINATSFSVGAGQRGTLAENWQEAEHPSNAGLGNFFNT